ncbi:MAG: ABC transporter permease, partial [Lachnospiraceae bacterium]|nr:ABC transporter permease [Lachnospiraceae bacterium]
MQTLKLFMLLLRRNLVSLLIYAVIFVVIAMLVTGTAKENGEQFYQDSDICFTVLNRDGSRLGEAIKEYLAVKNTFVEEPDELTTLQNEMFYREIYYALIIPEGFEAAVLAGEDMALENYKVKDSAMGYYLDMQVDGYLSALRAYLAAGLEPEEAISRAGKGAGTASEVAVYSGTSAGSRPQLYYYYRSLAYIFLAMLTSALGNILIAFNRDKVRMRTLCSSLSFSSRNMQLALGVVIVGAGVWLLFGLIAFLMYREESTAFTFLASGMNSLCFVTLSVALSVMLGFLAKRAEVLAPLAIVASLGPSFLGGVFVPLEEIGGSILKVAKFMPTYWYIIANNAIV